MDPTQNDSFDNAMQGGQPVPSNGSMQGGQSTSPNGLITGGRPVIPNGPMAGGQPVVSNRPMVGGQPVASSGMMGGGMQPMNNMQPVVPSNQPMGYNGPAGPSMDYTGPSDTLITSGEGDIVLDGGGAGEGKSKKWWIVGGVVACIILIAVIGLVWWRGGGGGSSLHGNNLQEAFNTYANYFFMGEENNKTNAWLDYESIESDSFFKKSINGIDDSADSALKKMVKYYEDFYTLYTKTDDGYDFLDEATKEYSDMLGLVVTYHETGLPSMSDITELYVNNGETAAKEAVADEVEVYKKYGTVYQTNFYNLAVEWENERLAMVKKYDQFGCIKEGIIDYNCAALPDDPEKNAISEKISKLSFDIDRIMTNGKTDLNREIYTIKEGLDGLTMDLSDSEGDEDE